MGVTGAGFIPVYSAIASLASRQYGREIGGFWAAASLGFGSATLLGGLVYEMLDARYLFALGAVYGYLGVVAVLLLPTQGLSSKRHVEGSRTYTGLLRQRKIFILLGVSLLTLIAASSFNGFFTLYLVNLGGSRLLVGLAATGTTVLGAIAFKLVGPLNDKIGRKPVFLIGTLSYVAYFVTIYYVTDTTLVTILWVLPIYPLIRSSAAALASDYTSTADRGIVLGLLESSISLGGGLGPLAGGLIADELGLRQVIVFSLGTALLSMILSQILLSERRPEGTTEAKLGAITTPAPA